MKLPKYLPLKFSIGICMIVMSVMATSALYDDTGMGTTVTSGNQFTANMWNTTVSNIRDIYSRTQYIGTSGGNTALTGQLTAGSYIGNGSGITSLNPANISAGTAGINITGNSQGITFRDTRATSEFPQDMNAGIRADFKQNTVNGLADGGTYNGVLTFRSYGNSSDFSG
jgi:hypothetical protein